MSYTNVFVFGSNLAGRHGAGAALYARQHYGAAYGQGVGLSPSPGPLGLSYAIPTKDKNIKTLPLGVIEAYVHQFLDFADYHYWTYDEYEFCVTPIGCGLAGYAPKDILPLFLSWKNGKIPHNVVLPNEFLDLL